MKNLIVKTNITLKEAMQLLDKTAEQCLIVADESKKLLGTLTDGDIRRSILLGIDFHASIINIYCSNPIFLKKSEFSEDRAKELFRINKIRLIPIVDNKKILIDYVTWNKLKIKNLSSMNSLSNIPVVIMAGGKGSRLDPFTKILPKPLIPINDKTMIEIIIDSFVKFNCNNFFITVNYKQKIIKAYFEELDHPYSVSFIDEDKPLGTAGSLKLINNITSPFFIINCDIMIKTDYCKIYDFHKKGNFDLTLVASAKEYVIPYGTCTLNKQGYLSHIDEKPKYDFLINTGLYIVNPDVLKLIPNDKMYHVTDLIKDINSKNGKIGVFPVSENSWIDIGQWAEYEKAIKNL